MIFVNSHNKQHWHYKFTVFLIISTISNKNIPNSFWKKAQCRKTKLKRKNWSIFPSTFFACLSLLVSLYGCDGTTKTITWIEPLSLSSENRPPAHSGWYLTRYYIPSREPLMLPFWGSICIYWNIIFQNIWIICIFCRIPYGTVKAHQNNYIVSVGSYPFIS